MMHRLFAALLIMLGLAARVGATAEDLRSVAGMEHQNRVLLVFAPSLTDGRLAQQRAIFAKAALDAAERDLLLVQVDSAHVLGAHDDARKLRQRFRIKAGDYRTLLIGKDGNVALTSVGPIDAPRLKAAIDAMPMRQDEIRRARDAAH
jgi:hypothetical protein